MNNCKNYNGIMAAGLHLNKRVLAILCISMLMLSQLTLLVPAVSYAQTAGDVLVVRVQYYGEAGNHIREKASFTRAQLEAMGSTTYYYSNVTSVGTVMVLAAKGPKVMSIIEAAGIDANSIKNITFKTTDGYTRNFTVAGHMNASKYYYPNLSSNYERNDDGNALKPGVGALDGRVIAPAILATSFGETKQPGVRAEDLSLSTNKTYRFCMGQSKLTEGKLTSGGDVTSVESCHSIYGIDVTLAGSPIKGISLNLDDKTIKVGSQKKITASIDVEEAFEGVYSAEDLSWKSSDSSIATVDSHGNVTVKKKGAFTITATAPDGTKASININGDPNQGSGDNSDEGKNGDQANAGESGKSNSKAKASKTVKEINLNAREIKLGDVVVEQTSLQDENRAKMAEDAQALDAADSYSHGAAVGTAVGVGGMCLAGALVRLIKYKKLF